MGKRKFKVIFELDGWDVDSGLIELDQKVIDVVDDEWRSQLYDLHTPEEIAAHIGYNLILNKAKLTDLDGWADLTNDLARVIRWPNLDDFSVKAEEIE